MERINIIGVNISATNIEDSINHIINNIVKTKNNYICVSNVHTTVVARDNLSYRIIQNNSFMSLPDGKPLSVIGKIKGNKKIDRITGPDFLEKILSDDRFKNYKHFFYGNTKENLKAFIETIKNKYPKVNISGYEESKFRELNEDEKKELKDKIIKSNTDFVWVALGAPKQEFFCSEMCGETNACWIGVGGAFNVISGVIPRAPKWIQELSLEWLFRLTKEPKRLYKRYLITNTKFIFYLFMSFFAKNNGKEI